LSRTRSPWPALPATVALLLVAPALLGRGAFFERDIHWVWLPRVESMVRAVAQGAWPLWDPHPAFGLPALADPSYQIAYPATWLNLVLPPAASYAWYVLIHLGLAGVGAYALGRCWGLSHPAAALAGGAWVATGPVLSFVSLYHHFAGLAWMPWLLAALERTLTTPGLRPAALLATATACQILAGSGDLCLMTALLGLAVVGHWLVRSRPKAQALRAAGGALLLSGALALLVAAVQWLPTAAVLSSGSRLALAPWANLYWSLHPALLADMVAPKLALSLRFSPEARALLFESREPFLSSLYLGPAALLLAFLGGLLGGSRRLLLVAAAGFFLLCALGRHTVLYPLLLHVPPFGMMRYPVKYAGPLALVVCLLAGMGLDTWRREWSLADRRRAMLAVALAVCLGAALVAAAAWLGSPDALGLVEVGSRTQVAAGRVRLGAAVALSAAGLLALRTWRRSTPVALAMAALAIGDLLAAGRSLNSLAPPTLVSHRPAWSAGLENSTPPARLYVEPAPSPTEAVIAPAPPGWSVEWWWTLGVQDLLAPPIASRWGIDSSYDGDFTGLAPRELPDATQILGRARGSPASLRLLQAGGVDYVVALADRPWLEGPAREQASSFQRPISVFRVPGTRPRAYVVDAVRAASSPLGALLDPGFDLAAEAVIEGVAARPHDPAFRGTARVLARRADALSLLVEASAPAQLVVLDGYAAGWHAAVDGRPAIVRRANGLFRAVEVPAGRHAVELWYRPAAAMAGAALSGLGLLALGAVALLGWRVEPPASGG
jgi:hypothetical protein